MPSILDQNPWGSFLEETPGMAYNAYRPKLGSNRYLDFWLNSGGRVQNQYGTRLAEMAKGGQAPGLNLVDYLGDYDWLSEWLKMSPQSRGERATQTGGARWVIPR